MTQSLIGSVSSKYSTMKRLTYIFIVLFVCLFTACSTSKTASMLCPDFKSTNNKYLKKPHTKLSKRGKAYKSFLSEKFAENRREEARKNAEKIQPLSKKAPDAIASNSPDLKLKKRKSYQTFRNEVVAKRNSIPDKKKLKKRQRKHKKIQKYRQKLIPEQKQEKTKTFNEKKARTGGILGILSLCLLIIPYINFFTPIIAIVAIAMILKNSPKGRKGITRTGLAMAGVLLGMFLITIWFIALIASI